MREVLRGAKWSKITSRLAFPSPRPGLSAQCFQLKHEYESFVGGSKETKRTLCLIMRKQTFKAPLCHRERRWGVCFIVNMEERGGVVPKCG